MPLQNTRYATSASPTGSLPKCSQQPGLGRSKPGARNSTQVSCMGDKGPRTWAILCCLLDVLAGKQTRNRSSGTRTKPSDNDITSYSTMSAPPGAFLTPLSQSPHMQNGDKSCTSSIGCLYILYTLIEKQGLEKHETFRKYYIRVTHD